MGIKKKENKIIKPCTNCFSPQYLKFNLSYVKYDKEIPKEHKAQLLDRMFELSEELYITILNRDKKIGLEFEEIKIRKRIPSKFEERFRSKDYNNKFAIMRLYPNNNPIVARVIGVVIKNIFYVIYIDMDGSLYKH